MLEKTLNSFKDVVVPSGMGLEMIVVDNGSIDRTEEVIRDARHPAMEIHYMREARPGKRVGFGSLGRGQKRTERRLGGRQTGLILV